MEAVCLPRPAGFSTLLAPGEPVRSNSWTNQRVALRGTRCALQAKQSKRLCAIPQIISAIRVLMAWASAFSRRTAVSSSMRSTVRSARRWEHQSASPFPSLCRWGRWGPEEATYSKINNLSQCPEWQTNLEPTLCSSILHYFSYVRGEGGVNYENSIIEWLRKEGNKTP